MAMTVETALLNNQSTLENFALVEELNAQSAEIISGGCYGGDWDSYWDSDWDSDWDSCWGRYRDGRYRGGWLGLE